MLLVQPVLHERGFQVVLDAAIQVLVDALGLAFHARRLHGDLVGHDQARRSRLGIVFSLRLFVFRLHVAVKRDYALVAVFADFHVLEAIAVQSCADCVFVRRIVGPVLGTSPDTQAEHQCGDHCQNRLCSHTHSSSS